MKLLEYIFSVKNSPDFEKVITVFGLQYRIKNTVKQLIWLTKRVAKMESYQEQLKVMLDSCCDITKCKKATGLLRKVQLARLNGLKIVTDIFEKNNLEYWLDYGTLLGLYRHEGFIPWDDDIDISMTRENFVNAQSVLQKEFEKLPLRMSFGENNTGFFMKIKYEDFVLFDVYVFDVLDNSTEDVESLYTQWKRARKSFNIDTLEKIRTNVIKIQDTYSILNDYYKEVGLFENTGNVKYIFKGIDAAQKNNKPTFHRIENVFPLQKAKFENYEFLVPRLDKTVEYLNECDAGNYGDIMKFPSLSAVRRYNLKEVEESYVDNMINIFRNILDIK